MITLLRLALPGCLLVLAACSPTPSGPPALDRKAYTLTGASQCDTTTNKGIDLSVSYLQLRDESDAARQINDSLQQLGVGSITAWLDSTDVATHPEARTNLKAAADLFAASYQSLLSEMGGLGGCWQLETKMDTLFSSPNLLTARMETFAYTGGAHPNANVTLMTFDRRTGRPVNLADIVADTTALLGVVETAFRKQQGLLPQYNLEERGYFLRDGHFFLPANIGVGRKGLIFYYNPYEIAAYAVGPIEVVVPYEQMNGMLKSGWM
ncbi:hypothetical protein GCM10027578_00500 [Spirosoma luteolum]